MEAEEQRGKTWRAARSRSELKLLGVFGEVVFGKTYDAALKLAVKTSKSPEDALSMSGLAELFEDSRAKRDAEMKASPALQDEKCKGGEPCPASPTAETDVVCHASRQG